MPVWKKYLSLSGIGFLKLFAYIPFPVLYAISHLMYYGIYYLIRYRRDVVSANLANTFPEKESSELKVIERRYYRYLCDLTLEALKTVRMDGAELNKRMVIRNPELLNRYSEQGRSVLVMAMHYGNWEWLLHMPVHIRHHHYFVYKPLQNPWFDMYMNTTRSRFGGETISMNISLRKIIEAENLKKPVLTWLAADQTPPWFHPFWTTFLNQEAQFFDGPAKIAKRFNQPVIFQHVNRNRRGIYETWFEVLVDDPQNHSEEEITLAYVDKIERVIKSDPYYYLWSHRRWKHKRPSTISIHCRG